jgi:hypothetical protein
MSKNKKSAVLNESLIRRFMKLSNLKPLTPGFIKRLSEGCPGYVEEEGLMEELPGEEEEEMEMGGMEEPGMGEPEMGEPELGGEEEMAGAGGDEAMVKNIVSAIADAIQDVAGVEVTVSGSGEEAPGEELPGEEMPPEAGGEEMPPMGDEEEEVEELDEEVVEEEEIVAEKKTITPAAVKDPKSSGIANTGKLRPLSEAMVMKVAKLVAERLVKESKSKKAVKKVAKKPAKK